MPWPVWSPSARERRTLKGFLGGVVVPALRIEGWTFTGDNRALTDGRAGPVMVCGLIVPSIIMVWFYHASV